MSDLDPALYIKAYTAFAETRAADRSCKLPFLDYARYKFTPPRDFGVRLFFCNAAEDCARQIVNDIHDLRRAIQNASIWQGILQAYSERQQFLLNIEFVEIPVIHALSRPCALKNRFIYSLAMLATMYKARCGSSAEITPFEKCNYTTMKRLAGDWPGFSEFEAEFRKLNPTDFVKKSGDFRNRDHHRIPANIETGLAPGAHISVDDGRVSFSRAVLQPVRVADVLPSLGEQYYCACSCIGAFWPLIEKTEGHW